MRNRYPWVFGFFALLPQQRVNYRWCRRCRWKGVAFVRSVPQRVEDEAVFTDRELVAPYPQAATGSRAADEPGDDHDAEREEGERNAPTIPSDASGGRSSARTGSSARAGGFGAPG
jgi:hypothetical protein